MGVIAELRGAKHPTDGICLDDVSGVDSAYGGGVVVARSGIPLEEYSLIVDGICLDMLVYACFCHSTPILPGLFHPFHGFACLRYEASASKFSGSLSTITQPFSHSRSMKPATGTPEATDLAARGVCPMPPAVTARPKPVFRSGEPHGKPEQSHWKLIRWING